MAEKRFQPFADDRAALTVGGLTLENGTDRIALSGSLDLTRDREGLSQARALKAALDDIVRVLESAADLPAKVAETVEAPKSVRNPFG